MVRSLAMWRGDQTTGLGARFAKLWAASTISALGSGLATIATPLFVASRTSSPLIISAAFGIAWLPWLLFALPGGVLVDRVDRRRLMIVVDWSRVAAMGVLATAVLTGWASIPLLYAVLFIVNSGEIIFRSASQAMIPSVVPVSMLERANGWLVGGDTVAQQMLAGPLSGFLFVLGAGLPFLANAGTYAGSAVLIAWIAGNLARGSPRWHATARSTGCAATRQSPQSSSRRRCFRRRRTKPEPTWIQKTSPTSGSG
jgi:hypothetical protein